MDTRLKRCLFLVWIYVTYGIEEITLEIAN